MTAALGSPLAARVLLVTYDLKTPGRNYTPFYEALKQQGAWWHYIASTWLVVTSKTPEEAYQALGPHLSIQDSILIVPITRPYWGFLPQAAWDWLEQNLPH
jgi:hypothetical protein